MQMPGGTQKQTLNRAVIIPGVQTALYPEQLEINKWLFQAIECIFYDVQRSNLEVAYVIFALYCQ